MSFTSRDSLSSFAAGVVVVTTVISSTTEIPFSCGGTGAAFPVDLVLPLKRVNVSGFLGADFKVVTVVLVAIVPVVAAYHKKSCSFVIDRFSISALVVFCLQIEQNFFAKFLS